MHHPICVVIHTYNLLTLCHESRPVLSDAWTYSLDFVLPTPYLIVAGAVLIDAVREHETVRRRVERQCVIKRPKDGRNLQRQRAEVRLRLGVDVVVCVIAVTVNRIQEIKR